jgi:hypothetical protein
MTTPLHGAPTRTNHFRGEMADGKKFVFCPIGNIVSWLAADYEFSYCGWCKKYFKDIIRDGEQ